MRKLKLTKRDSETLAAALMEPDPQPNDALKRAARKHDEEVTCLSSKEAEQFSAVLDSKPKLNNRLLRVVR